MSSDASISGWSLAGAFWPREVVSSVGHNSELSRFRRCEGPNARDHVFRTADAPDELWIEDPNFPEVLDRYWRPTPWKLKGAGMWAHKEDIRAGVKRAPQSPLASFVTHLMEPQ